MEVCRMNYMVESERLLLRSFRISDAEAYYQLTLDDEIQKYVAHACAPTFEETLQNIKFSYSQGDFVHDYYLLLEEKQTHKLVGAIIATQIGTQTLLETHILTHRNYRNKGYMSEALNIFISTLPKGTVLIFTVKKNNQASLRTVSKIPGINEILNFIPKTTCRIFNYTVV